MTHVIVEPKPIVYGNNLDVDINWVRETATRSLERAVLYALARQYHRDCDSMMRIAAVADEIGYSYSATARALRRLEDRSLVKHYPTERQGRGIRGYILTIYADAYVPKRLV